MGTSAGIVWRASNSAGKQAAKRIGLDYVVSDGWELPFDRTLFMGPDIMCLTDELIRAAFHWLERWELAAPIWRYNSLVSDIGTLAERERTVAIIRDARMLVYAPHQILFARRTEQALKTLDLWRADCEQGDDPRLSWLRAFYTVKPLFLQLPSGWLVEMGGQARTRPPRSIPIDRGLIRLKLGPGRYVQCLPGEEEATLERMRRGTQ